MAVRLSWLKYTVLGENFPNVYLMQHLLLGIIGKMILLRPDRDSQNLSNGNGFPSSGLVLLLFEKMESLKCGHLDGSPE